MIFDLDGTLIDSRQRLYKLFQKLVPASKLSYELYWNFKRNQVSNETILREEFSYNLIDIKSFVTDWMSLIESSEFLAFDDNFPGMHSALDRLSSQATLHVCTARQHRQPVFHQLDRLGLLPFFKSVMVTEQTRSKEELIATVPDLGSEDWILGDTGKDIKVGQAIGIKTCAVLSGFLSEDCLKSYGPDLIIPVASDFYF